MKILNLYAGIGGNRKLWGDVDVVAIEYDVDIAGIYSNLYPKDKVIIADAHEYLLKHYKEFDFIWSSPPCQTHSSFRKNICVEFRGTKTKYPDMELYEEILLLQHYYKGRYVVENVASYYKPLIVPQEIQRHYFWANFYINNIKLAADNLRSIQIPELQKKYGIDLSGYKIKNKRQILRNCVEPELGLHIFQEANREYKTLL